MAGKDERDGIASATNPMRNLHFDVDGSYRHMAEQDSQLKRKNCALFIASLRRAAQVGSEDFVSRERYQFILNVGTCFVLWTPTFTMVAKSMDRAARFLHLRHPERTRRFI